MKFEELKKVLFDEIRIDKRSKKMLIEAYITDENHVRKIIKEDNVPAEAWEFLEYNKAKIAGIMDEISIQFFRDAKYEELIKVYSIKQERLKQIAENNIPEVVPKAEVLDIDEEDDALEETGNYSGAIDRNLKEWLLEKWGDNADNFMKELIEGIESERIIWRRSKSGRTYYIVLNQDKKVKIRCGQYKDRGEVYLERGKKREQISERLADRFFNVFKEKGINVLKGKSKIENPFPVNKDNLQENKKEETNNEDIYEILVPLILAKKQKQQIKNKKLHQLTVQRLRHSDKEYGFLIKRTHENDLKWKIVKNSLLEDNVYIARDRNGDKLLLHSFLTEEAVLYRFYRKGELTFIGGIQQYLEKAILAREPQAVKDFDLTGYYPIKVLQAKTVSARKAIDKQPASANKVIEKQYQKKRMNVGIKNIVVRRNIFKCMHNKHSIEDVDAVVRIMNRNAEIEETVVSAGYCKECDIFFMMESTYQQLRKRGAVVFRAVDEKNYLNRNYMNGKILAQESVLMQFGYSVSQSEGLSETRRHKILSVLVDNHILTKSEIISYLDFFINQRRNEKFAMAVAKWTIDRNYIRNYKIGEYSRIGVVYRND